MKHRYSRRGRWFDQIEERQERAERNPVVAGEPMPDDLAPPAPPRKCNLCGCELTAAGDPGVTAAVRGDDGVKIQMTLCAGCLATVR